VVRLSRTAEVIPEGILQSHEHGITFFPAAGDFVRTDPGKIAQRSP